MVQIRDLKADMKDVFLVAEVKERKLVTKNLKDGTNKDVQEMYLEDGTGRIKLTYWEMEPMFQAGQIVEITNGYMGDFKGRLELKISRYGGSIKVSAKEAIPTPAPTSGGGGSSGGNITVNIDGLGELLSALNSYHVAVMDQLKILVDKTVEIDERVSYITRFVAEKAEGGEGKKE